MKLNRKSGFTLVELMVARPCAADRVLFYPVMVYSFGSSRMPERQKRL
jgi:hypothetical protein